MSDILKHTIDLFELDSIQYAQGFEYYNSVYKVVDFFELGNLDLFSIVQSPPKNSSETTQQELQEISRLTKNRTKEEEMLVYSVDLNSIALHLEAVEELGIEFDYKAYNTLYPAVSEMIDHLKYFYNRARPFQIADKLSIDINRIITKTHHTPSYPSGHTMSAVLASKILTDKYPEHESKFNEIAEKCGHARVLQGVHYPSDNTASIKIINKIYPIIKKYFTE